MTGANASLKRTAESVENRTQMAELWPCEHRHSSTANPYCVRDRCDNGASGIDRIVNMMISLGSKDDIQSSNHKHPIKYKFNRSESIDGCRVFFFK